MSIKKVKSQKQNFGEQIFEHLTWSRTPPSTHHSQKSLGKEVFPISFLTPP